MGMLDNKVAIVTGGGRGIGAGISIALAEAGAHVLIAGRNMENNRNIEKKIKDYGGSALSVKMDVTNEKDIKSAFKSAINEFGRLDILVNNAAVDTYEKALSLSLDDWDYIFNINTRALFHCSQNFAQFLIKNGWGGSIINIASNAGKIGFPMQVHYNASKSAVISITQSLSKEFAEHNINVNAVCPGAVDTDMLYEAMISTEKHSKDNLTVNDLRNAWAPPQLGRLIDPIEIGRVVAFFASDDAKIIRGQSINLDAGMTY